MKSSYGYGAYRGRKRVRRILKGTILVLAVILALMLAAYFLLRPYMVYTEDGVYISLPFFRSGEGGENQETQQDDGTSDEGTGDTEDTGAATSEDNSGEDNWNVIIDDPAAQSPAEGGALHAALLPLTAISDGTASEQLNTLGANAVIFDMKADDGSLGYDSEVSLAVKAGVSSDQENINQDIIAFNDGDYYTVARVSCFKDDAVALANGSLAITTNSGYRWSDVDEIHWLNPYYSETQNYLVKICVEIAKLGFDEILLDHCTYPTEGNLHYIKTNTAYQSAAFPVLLDTFYKAVTEALSNYDIKVSLVTDEETLTEGENGTSGQTAELLAAYADRVYVSADVSAVSAFADILKTSGLEDAESKLVILCRNTPEETEYSWAYIPTS